MDFLRKMDSAARESAVVSEWGGDSGGCAALAERLRIHPPEPLETLLIPLPQVTPLPRIRNALRGLGEKAYVRAGKDFPLP